MLTLRVGAALLPDSVATLLLGAENGALDAGALAGALVAEVGALGAGALGGAVLAEVGAVGAGALGAAVGV